MFTNNADLKADQKNQIHTIKQVNEHIQFFSSQSYDTHCALKRKHMFHNILNSVANSPTSRPNER